MNSTDTRHTSEAVGERILRGLPAAAGIAIGPVYHFSREEPTVEETDLRPDQVENEIALWNEAVERSHKELTKILSFAQQRLGYSASNIFEGQLLMLCDTVLQETVEKRIREEKKNADYIVLNEITRYLDMFLTTQDEHLSERTTDLKDVKNRLIRNIQRKRLYSRIEGQYVIISHNLTPADTVLFSRSDVLAYATDIGGITSHAAILSRSLKIPAVVGLQTISQEIENNQTIIIDGYQGLVILNPTPERISEYQRKIVKIEQLEMELAEIAGLPCITTDGHKVELSANAEFIDELDYVIMQGSRGIGLYRTEHLYIAQGGFPTEEEQYEAYREIAQRIYPQSIIIRTFDIGGDKVLENTATEKNPSLGWRGIRMMLDQPEIFKNQLRAILRASVQKNLKMMFPMISGLEELREANLLVEEVRSELRRKKVRFDPNIESGIMIEVPSAILVAEQLARETSFFSLGTNDLTQYVLAVDRTNDMISDMYQEVHPAIIRAIRQVVDIGHRNNIWVGICGEMAGNLHTTLLLLGLGLDEFSVVPAVLPEVKKIIRLSSLEEAREIAEHCLTLDTVQSVKEYLYTTMHTRFPELFFPES